MPPAGMNSRHYRHYWHQQHARSALRTRCFREARVPPLPLLALRTEDGLRPVVNRPTCVDAQIREARMLTIGGFLVRFTRAERHKESSITTVRSSGKTPDPAERERQHWEAIQRSVDELVAHLSQSSDPQP
jgi:hypothetical protein